MKKFITSFMEDLKDFKKLAPQMRFVILVQVIILFILSLLIGIVFSPKFRSSIIKQQSPQEKDLANDSLKKNTRFSFSPTDTIMKVGEERDIALEVSGNYPTVADINLTYNPTFIKVIKITKGDVFEQEIAHKIQSGRVIYSAAIAPDQDPTLQGKVVLVISLKALQRTTSTEILFDTEKTIAARGEDNILESADGMVIRIFDEP